MSDLQMVSVSSESSGQSGSPSQSQASGMQVSLSRQWNSPTSHEMASKMAWWKSKEKETKDVTWSNDHDQVDHVSNLKVCARCTHEHGWTCFEWMWWRGIMLLFCTVHVHCASFAYNFVGTGCHTNTPHAPIQPHPQEIKLPKPRWHRHCRGIVILTASTSKTWCPLRLGKLLQSTFASLFLSCCLLGGMLSFDGGTGGVQWKPSQLKSHHSCSI